MNEPRLVLFGDYHDLGFLPEIFLPSDERPAREQINERYAHGGGWRPMGGWRFEWHKHVDPEFPHVLTITYPGDPTYGPLACFCLMSGEQAFIYPYAWVALVSPEGDIEVARMD